MDSTIADDLVTFQDIYCNVLFSPHRNAFDDKYEIQDQNMKKEETNFYAYLSLTF